MSPAVCRMFLPSSSRSRRRNDVAIQRPDFVRRSDGCHEVGCLATHRGNRIASRLVLLLVHLFAIACVLGMAGASPPAQARFLSPDPVPVNKTDGSNFNRYWYANNNPYKYVDPDGRESGCIHGGGCGGMPSPTQNAVFGAAMDFVPGIGDVKGVVEAVQEPSPTNILSALADVIPVIGNAVGDGIKAAGKIGDAEKRGTCSSCGGRTTTSEAGAAQALGMSTREVKNSIHALKQDAGSATKQTNSDVEICTACGEAFPLGPSNTHGDSIGNVKER